MDWSKNRTARYQPGEGTPSVSWPRGFRAQGVACGIKPSGNLDLSLVLCDEPAAAAGVFTQNAFPGAPVTISKRHISNGQARAIICNSGNSNVCNGTQGEADALEMCQLVAETNGLKTEEVLVASTGIIGVPLPMLEIREGIEQLNAIGISSGDANDANASEAILTTDLVRKWDSLEVEIGGQAVRIAGMAKGSGMISPNMATMLSFITSDAAIEPTALQTALSDAVHESFNCISVDADTSTSDMVLVLANGKAENQKLTQDSGDDYVRFKEALTSLCRSLAYQIIQDGEGMEHVIKVRVKCARSMEDAKLVAKTVIDSPLVKTAVHGKDPNWGRLIMAIGRSGASIDPDKIRVHLGDVLIVDRGRGASDLNDQKEALEAIMSGFEVPVTIDLGESANEYETTWLGCDLSREYICINADYTT